MQREFFRSPRTGYQKRGGDVNLESINATPRACAFWTHLTINSRAFTKLYKLPRTKWPTIASHQINTLQFIELTSNHSDPFSFWNSVWTKMQSLYPSSSNTPHLLQSVWISIATNWNLEHSSFPSLLSVPHFLPLSILFHYLSVRNNLDPVPYIGIPQNWPLSGSRNEWQWLSVSHLISWHPIHESKMDEKIPYHPVPFPNGLSWLQNDDIYLCSLRNMQNSQLSNPDNNVNVNPFCAIPERQIIRHFYDPQIPMLSMRPQSYPDETTDNT